MKFQKIIQQPPAGGLLNDFLKFHDHPSQVMQWFSHKWKWDLTEGVEFVTVNKNYGKNYGL